MSKYFIEENPYAALEAEGYIKDRWIYLYSNLETRTSLYKHRETGSIIELEEKE